MTEEVRWTAAGKAQLAAVPGALYRDTDDAELRANVFAAAKKQAAKWKRGATKADDEGRAAVALAGATLAKGKLPKRPSVDDAARLLSLLGASDSENVEPLGELLLRAEGLPFAMAVLARMWSHESHSSDRAIWITALDDDDDHVHDASCSYSKATFTYYLHRRYRTAKATERTAMKKGVTAIWKATTPHARPALAYATRDPARAAESARELIHAGESPWPFFAWAHLPYVMTDVELVLRLLRDDSHVNVDLIDNLGTAIWDRFVDELGGQRDQRSRAELLRDFSNFYGPKTALIIAEYEDTKECAPVVRDYFALYPELLARVIDDPALKYHRDDLRKLTAGTPVPARPRS